jgi:putative ABC transport system permease protein
LIACANLTNLQFARATTRLREVAVRTALGASRTDIGRLILFESLALSVGGAAFGVLLAVPLVRAVIAAAPDGIPRLQEIHVSWQVLAFTSLAALFAAGLSGLASAVRLRRADLGYALKQDANRGITGSAVSRVRSVLVVAEVALTLLLAVAAGLLVRTMQSLNATNLGFRTEQLLVAFAHAPANTEKEYIARPRQMQNLLDDLGSTPGVQSAAGVMGLPAGQYGSNGRYELEGRTTGDDGSSESVFTLASPRYFSTLNIPLLRGREFEENDSYDSEFVAIISSSLARAAFPDQDPIGRKIRCGLDSPKWMTIVGIVGDVAQDSPASRPGPTLYMPLMQHPYHANEFEIVVRTGVTPASLIPMVRNKIQAVDPTIATKFTTMDDLLGDSIAAPRFRTYLLGSFALLGFVLTSLGVYGVMSYTVAQRSFEVGVRMTFGAERSQILRLMLGQAARLTALGVAIGLVISLAATRLMSSMLFGVRASDGPTIVIASAVIVVTALIAAYVPARHAASIDPIKALHYE